MLKGYIGRERADEKSCINILASIVGIEQKFAVNGEKEGKEKMGDYGHRVE